MCRKDGSREPRPTGSAHVSIAYYIFNNRSLRKFEPKQESEAKPSQDIHEQAKPYSNGTPQRGGVDLSQVQAMTPDQQIAILAESLPILDKQLNGTELRQVIQNITNSQISEIQSKFQMERDSCN